MNAYKTTLIIWVTILFGYSLVSLNGCLDDDSDKPESWHLRHDAVVPFSSNERAVAFDTNRQVLIVHGGTLMSDTWEFDGTTWTNIPTVHSPETTGRIVYDANLHAILFFSDESADDYHKKMTVWKYDGQDWTPISLGDGPNQRVRSSVTHDPSTGNIYLFSGLCTLAPYESIAMYDLWEIGR